MKQIIRYCLYVVGTFVVLAITVSLYPPFQGALQNVYFTKQLRTSAVSLDNTSVLVATTHRIASEHNLTTSSPQPATSKPYVVTTIANKTLRPRKSEDNRFYIYTETYPPDVTVVTAYIDIGSFRKGDAGTFDTEKYMGWAAVYTYIRNPFVVYTDSNIIANRFRVLRTGHENITKVIVVERKSLWAFDWVDRIRKIYSNPSYPKYHPNTVVPEYTCAQHAKYAVVEEAVKKNYFNTTYFTWLDLGYFRDIASRKKEFVITKPQNFNESRVAMNKVYDVDMNISVDSIFKGNHVWIGGGMFFGSIYTLPTFIADYRLAVERYLNMSLSSTDQQVLFAMNTDKETNAVRQRVPIQKYIPKGSDNRWFYLGYSCYRELM